MREHIHTKQIIEHVMLRTRQNAMGANLIRSMHWRLPARSLGIRELTCFARNCAIALVCAISAPPSTCSKGIWPQRVDSFRAPQSANAICTSRKRTAGVNERRLQKSLRTLFTSSYCQRKKEADAFFFNGACVILSLHAPFHRSS